MIPSTGGVKPKTRYHFRHQGRRLTVFRRSEDAGAPWHIHFQVAGRRIFRSLETADRSTAVCRARTLLAEALKGEWDRVDRRARGPHVSPGVPLLGRVFELYLERAPVTGPRNGVRLRTARNNVLQLRNHVALAEGLEPAAVDAVSLDVLTPALARCWREKWVEKYVVGSSGDQDEQRQQAARSGRSSIAQSRSVFNRWMLAAYRDAGLTVPPTVHDWIREPLFGAVRDEYRPASEEVVRRTFAAARELMVLDPVERDVAVAFWLAVGAGLRRGELGRVRAEEIVERDGQWWVASAALGKDGERIEVPLLTDAAVALRPYLGQESGVVLRHAPDKVGRWVSAWMAKLGWTSSKRLHELRAWAICAVGMEHGLDAARMFARHKDARVTLSKYGRYLKLRRVDVRLPGA